MGALGVMYSELVMVAPNAITVGPHSCLLQCCSSLTLLEKAKGNIQASLYPEQAKEKV